MQSRTQTYTLAACTDRDRGCSTTIHAVCALSGLAAAPAVVQCSLDLSQNFSGQ